MRLAPDGQRSSRLRFASGLRLRPGNRAVAGAAAIGVIAFGRAGSLALEDARVDALAVTTFAWLDQSLRAPHDTEFPFFSSRQ